MRLSVLAGMLGASLIAAGAAQGAGNAQNGQQIFGRCAMCHSSAKGEGARIGPNLFGVVGRKAGSVSDYSYSAAIKKAGFVWTNDKLEAFVTAPGQLVPGTKMTFSGLASAQQRADLIAYLDTLR
jgi:cytochrome c